MPCPFCGGTTAAMHLVDGDVAASITTNPLTVVLVAVGLVGLVLYALRALGRAAEPRPWTIGTQRVLAGGIAATLMASWAYQLTRWT